jgi:hypothetical protein
MTRYSTERTEPAKPFVTQFRHTTFFPRDSSSASHQLHAHTANTMPRSVADATRFTPTGPHAFTQASVASGGETPQQRVARLREAARKAKTEKAAGSAFDRILDRGRIWADRAHRVVAVGLMGATGMYLP